MEKRAERASVSCPGSTTAAATHPIRMPSAKANGKMNARTALTPADLFVLVDREFQRRRPRECTTCFVQLPYRVDSIEENGANWELVVPAECPHGCCEIVEEIVNELKTRYDLRPNGNGR
jgi:hypothetical protein